MVHRFPLSPVPSESLLKVMEQLLRSQLEKFDFVAEDSGGNSHLGSSTSKPARK